MFKSTDDKIGIREYTSIIFLGFCSKITDSTPTLYYKHSKNAGWMATPISALLTFLPFLLILYLFRKYKGKGLIDIIYLLMGKYLGFLVAVILFISHMIFTIANTRSYSNIIVTLFFPKSPLILIDACIIGASAFIASRGLKAIGRTAWILLPFTEGALIILLFLTKQEIRTEYLYPLLGGGIKNIIKDGVLYTSVFSEIITFSIFMPMIKNYKEFKLSSTIGLWIAEFQMMIFYAFYIGTFDYPAVVVINYPFHTLARFIHLTRFFTNLEAIFLLFWIIISLIRFSMYLYTVTGIFAYSIKTIKVEALIMPISALVLLLGMIPENNIITVQYLRNMNLQVTSAVYLVLPVLLLIISKMRGGHSCD